MPWIEFTEAFDFRPTRSTMLAFKAGHTLLVTTPAAEAAVAAGKGRRVPKPKADNAAD